MPPQGFGVRWDGGYESGDEVSQYYDNLVGKLIVWGDDRDTAIDRMIRALEELRIEGIATTIPADLAILAPPRLPRRRALHQVGRGHASTSPASASAPSAPAADDDEAPKVQRDVDVEVNGKRFAVKVWVPDLPVAVVAGGGGRRGPRPRRAAAAGGGGGGRQRQGHRARCRARS